MSNYSGGGVAKTRLLVDGHEIPVLGLGVWQIRNGSKTVDAVRWAFEAGYRHVDTAQAYGNEQSVGRAFRESGLSRSEVFITTKFYPNKKDPVAEIENSLERLGMEYVDLYLVHWPRGGPTWAWPGMERAHDLGLARSIGVSNFDVDELEAVIGIASTVPVVNQVQFSPFEYRRRLLEETGKRGVAFEAYSPLGTGRHLSNAKVNELAKQLGRTPAQVLLRWCLQRDAIVIPKSTHRERIEENAQIFDFSLSDQEIAELDSLDRTGGAGSAQERKWW